ncbi:kinase-like domain-containing protein [Rhexocercosporidium sp. MPI-PUGE-AT-0058]|nr:kinase-like domain-containing protein [Rhexocercosporidium sp. MPI-PUGE-AT-0058]
MNCVALDLNQIRPDQIDPAIGYGTFACVSRIAGTSLAVKVPFDEASHHIRIEQRIYERLGEHHLILKYHRQAVFLSGGRTTPMLLLQFLEAGTLEKSLNTPCWIQRRLEWLLQVAEAVAYIHSKTVIHCDVGCHNFLVQDNGTLALCDFGGPSIDGSEILEFPKPRYARPRPRLGEKPDVKDDIFALGTALYEISTGQTLYKGKSDNDIAALFRSHTYPDLQQLSPPGLGEIIRRCWSERYAVAEQVVCDLRKVLPDFACSALRPELRNWCLSTKLLLTTSLLSIFALYIFLSA